MQLGWTEWAWMDSETGHPITLEEAKEKYGWPDKHAVYDKIVNEGERLTELGRTILLSRKAEGK